jgi:NAD(P)-dependent dehydrogenase (short-subunit alcohol dehydrogenase family)
MFDRPVALVTGAARQGSIGRAIARRLLADGHRVVLSDLAGPLDTHPEYRSAGSADLAEALTELSPLGEVHTLTGDVRRPDEVQSLVDGTVARYGRLDVLVNNAGLGVGLTPVVDMRPEDWNLNLDVMATGVFLCSQAGARQMLAQGTGGRIITIASQAGKTGMPYLAAYCAAKFAAIGFTQALAHELGPRGITVNAVCPGTVDTPLLNVPGGVIDLYTGLGAISEEKYRSRLLRAIPLGRFAQPEDIADSVGFLASPAAAYITGEALNVTGGQEMH